MVIQFFIPFWGNEHLPLEEFFIKAKHAGYHGVEINIPSEKNYTDKLKKLLCEHELELIAQQWLPPAKESVDEYIERMREKLYYLASLEPLFINSHTGKDFYSFEENCRILEASESISKECGIKITHETHRGRCLYSAPMSKLYFNCFPDVKIAADFSHWCCTSESLLEEQESTVNEAIKRAEYIHARVGYEQGPQVNHPFAPENKAALNAHLKWWQKIIHHQISLGADTFQITPEFGPVPYMQSLPFTNQEVVNLWNINLEMKAFLKSNLKT